MGLFQDGDTAVWGSQHIHLHNTPGSEIHRPKIWTGGGSNVLVPGPHEMGPAAQLLPILICGMVTFLNELVTSMESLTGSGEIMSFMDFHIGRDVDLDTLLDEGHGG